MDGRSKASALTGLVVALGLAVSVNGQCSTIDFEDFAVGTVITNQYAGVSFSAVPGTCGPGSPAMMIASPSGGTSSGTRGLKIGGGCPDFSDDYLRMIFSQSHLEVSFTLGDWGTTYQVRVYSTVSGGSPFRTYSIATGAPGAVGVYRLVRVESLGASLIRRIEIEGATSNFEAIDDLSYGLDDTPPIADITSPVGSPSSIQSCVCGVVNISGTTCDDDGAYAMDTLEYRRSGDADWTLDQMFLSPLCGGGVLYVWEPAVMGLMEGWYDLRVTATNACGLSDSDVTTVYLDRSFSLDSSDWRRPEDGEIVGGSLCFEGTVWDRCFDQYSAAWAPLIGGTFQPVEPGVPVYNQPVTNDPFATWNTTTVSDGAYRVRVTGEDVCNNDASLTRMVTVDNTDPLAVITEPFDCTYVNGLVTVRGTANDVHLSSWSLSFVGGGVENWQTIATGNVPVINNVLGDWDTAGLDRCPHTLRLRVVDEALGGCGFDHVNVSDHYITVDVGSPFDGDRDGDIDLVDFAEFQVAFTGML